MNMKNFLRENWFRIVSPIVVIALFAIFLSLQSDSSSSSGMLVERQYNGSPISATGDITCTYPQGINGSYVADKISYEIPPPEKNPMIFTFSDIGEKVSKLKYIDSTQTISEVQIVKLSEDAERIVFIQADKYYVALHTIFKETGISLYSKHVSLIGIPLGTTAVGTCIDS